MFSTASISIDFDGELSFFTASESSSGIKSTNSSRSTSSRLAINKIPESGIIIFSSELTSIRPLRSDGSPFSSLELLIIPLT